MPPKKKPGKGGDGDGDSGAPKGKDAGLIGELGGDKLIMAKIELNSAMADVALKTDLLDEQKDKNDELKGALEAQREDARDIYFYLHQKLDDNYEVIDKLEKDKDKMGKDNEQAKERFEEQMKKIKLENDEAIAKLKESITKLEEETFQLKDFKARKVELEGAWVRLEEELQAEKDDHVNNVATLERRNVQEKERLKKDMLIKIKETKQKLLSMTESQLHTTTKRAIMENEQMTTELQ